MTWKNIEDRRSYGREAHLKKYGKTWGQIQYERSQKLRELRNMEKSLLPYTSYKKCATRFR